MAVLLVLPIWDHSDWMEWPGWVVIGSVAAVLSLLTLAGGLVGWLRTRRLYPPVIFEVGAHKVIRDQTGQAVGYRVGVTNLGRSTAHIRSVYFVGASVVDDIQSPQIEWVVPSTGHFEFDVTSPAIDEAWMMIISGSFEDNSLIRAAWYPLREGTNLALAHQRSYVDTHIHGGLIGAWQQRHPRPVGPGEDAMTYIRMRRNRLEPMLEITLKVIYTQAEVELRRSGTVQTGDPNKWAKVIREPPT